MNNPSLSIICAIGKNRSIGYKNKLVWHIPKDIEFFRKKTTSNTVIMGRKTFESIGKPLPNRNNIIVTKNQNFTCDNCIISHSLVDAISVAKKIEKKEIFIIGGGEIYKQSMGYVDKLYLTIIDEDFQGDTFFPDFSDWKLLNKRLCEDNQYKFCFCEFVRGEK